MMKIAHIINPFFVDKKSRNYFVQQITFESLKKAKEFSKDKIEISLYVTGYEEDLEMMPDGFLRTDLMHKSVLDFGDFKIQRKLPLLGDILNSLNNSTRADYFIYSNVDIAVMPNFYETVKRHIESGFDAFVINRRTISDNYDCISQLPLMYAELGIPHPGYDCFVFKRSLFNKFRLYNICIGVPYIGLALYMNLVTFSKRFAKFTNAHLTFHLGDDKPWMDEKYQDYTLHNYTENDKVIDYLRYHIDPNKINEIYIDSN